VRDPEGLDRFSKLLGDHDHPISAADEQSFDYAKDPARQIQAPADEGLEPRLNVLEPHRPWNSKSSTCDPNHGHRQHGHVAGGQPVGPPCPKKLRGLQPEAKIVKYTSHQRVLLERTPEVDRGEFGPVGGAERSLWREQRSEGAARNLLPGFAQLDREFVLKGVSGVIGDEDRHSQEMLLVISS